MVTITLHCPRLRDAKLSYAMATRRRAQTAVSLPCVRTAKPRDPHSQRLDCKLAARRSCTQAQERSSLRGLTRTFGVSRTTVSNWIKKKELNFLPYVQPCSPRIPRIPLPRRWNWMNGWLVCAQKSQGDLGVDCPVPQDTTGRRLCSGGSE